MKCKKCGKTLKALNKECDECPDCGSPVQKSHDKSLLEK